MAGGIHQPPVPTYMGLLQALHPENSSVIRHTIICDVYLTPLSTTSISFKLKDRSMALSRYSTVRADQLVTLEAQGGYIYYLLKQSGK